MGIVHNGNIVNYFSLKEEMEESFEGHNCALKGQNDGELMLRLFQSFYIEESHPSKIEDTTPPFWIIQTSMRRLSEKIEGGYALLLIIEGVGLVAPIETLMESDLSFMERIKKVIFVFLLKRSD